MKSWPVIVVCVVLASAALLAAAGAAVADEIVMKNGDRLKGTVKKVEGGVLTFTTEYSKPLSVDKDKVERISTDGPVEVHLESGEVLKGVLRTEPDGRIVAESAAGREATVVDWSAVKAINPEPRKWTGRVKVGAGMKRGNTDSKSAVLGAEAKRRTDRDRFELRFLYNYAEEDKEVTSRNTYGSLKYDYFIAESFYVYLALELLKDEFRDLNLRSATGGGVGYEVWDEPGKSLLFELGLTYFSEDRKEGEDTSEASARVASVFKWAFGEYLVFTERLLYYPSLERSKKYLVRNEASLSAPLAFGWALDLMNIYEHDSDPPEGVRNNDSEWILSLAYRF